MYDFPESYTFDTLRTKILDTGIIDQHRPQNNSEHRYLNSEDYNATLKKTSTEDGYSDKNSIRNMSKIFKNSWLTITKFQ